MDIKSFILNIFEINDRSIIFELEKVGEIYLIGGALRHYRLDNSAINLNDIDIVISVNNEDCWNHFIKNKKHIINRFGGYKIDLGYISIDIWRIEETWAYKNGKVKSSYIDYGINLQYTVFLNIDSIIYHWQSDTWYDSEFNKAIKTNTIDIVLEDNPALILNITKALIISYRYSMDLSEKLKLVIRNEIYRVSLNELLRMTIEKQKKRYKVEILPRQYLYEILNSISSV